MTHSLDEQIKIMSGQAQAELDAARIQIAADRDRTIRERREVRQARAQVAASGKQSDLLPTIQALTQHEIRNYSVTRLIKNQLEHQRACTFNPSGPRPALCLEDEIGISLQADLKMVPELGTFVPLILASGLDTNTNSGGKYLVGEQPQDIHAYL